jgi:hypothetical protein
MGTSPLVTTASQSVTVSSVLKLNQSLFVYRRQTAASNYSVDKKVYYYSIELNWIYLHSVNPVQVTP